MERNISSSFIWSTFYVKVIFFIFQIAIPFSISAEDMRQYHVRFLFKQRHSNEGNNWKF